MLDGKMYALGEQPTTLAFAIELSRGHGKMTAHNPITGEKFEGTYSAVFHRNGGPTAVVIAPASNAPTPLERGIAQGSAQGAAIATATRPTRATGKGVLIGDMGTTIEIALDITPGGFLPGTHPHGVGEGVDNKGRRYQVQF